MSDDDKIIPIEGHERKPKGPEAFSARSRETASQYCQMSPVEYGRSALRSPNRSECRGASSIRNIASVERSREMATASPIFSLDVQPWHKHVGGDELLTEIAAAALSGIGCCQMAEQRSLHCGPSSLTAMTFSISRHWWPSPAPRRNAARQPSSISESGRGSRDQRQQHHRRCIVSGDGEMEADALVDEADTFIGDRDELRGVINSGHERNKLSDPNRWRRSRAQDVQHVGAESDLAHR